MSEVNPADHIILRVLVGSHAYGLAQLDSDYDYKGIYLAPTRDVLSLKGVPEQLERRTDVVDEVYWELKKFLKLALAANPNILDTLYSPLVQTVTPIAQELLGMRSVFLSQRVYTTYRGYASGQLKKLEQDLRTRGEIRWKHACHLIRLLISGITVLREGYVLVDVCDYRERLLTIRRGEVAWEEINVWRLELEREIDSAMDGTKLPKVPDEEKVNEFLIKTRLGGGDER